MAAKRKQQNKAVEQKPPNSVDLADAGVPSSARRSRRLRGVEVEFNANVLDEIERERRSSRSRSRSATPSFDRSSKFEQSVGQAKFPDAGPSKPSANSSTNHNNASPQRARINFEQDDSIIGDKDAMESGDNDEEEGDEKEQETEEKGKNDEMDEEGVQLGEKAEQKDEKLERFAGQKKDGKETDTDGSEEEDEDDEEEQEKDEEEDEMSEEGIQFGEEEAQNQRQNKGKKREQYNEQKKGRGTENDGREEEEGQDEEEEEVKDEEDEEEEEQDNCEEIGQEGVQFARKQKNRRGTENDGREEEEGQDEEEEGQDEEDEEEEEEENYEEIGEEGVQFARKQKGKKLEQFNGHKTNGREEEDEDEEEEGKEQQEEDESGYEEDIEDPKAVQQRRGKLPKSALDDKFFNLAEMNAFLETEDKKEDEKARRKNDRNLGQIENADEIEQMISAYEQTNLQQREWALLGEAKAEERPKDALLEQFVDADYRMLAPPTIDAEKTAQLESIIIKRIKDGLFDDVVRKVRINESLQSAASYRNATVVGKTEQKVRKSLAEVYGDKYSATINETEEFGGEGTKDGQPKFDPAVEAIKKDLDTLFLKLDALSHFQFRPQPIQEEVKILNNMPSLHMEEVGPQAAVGPEVNLLAPEEVTRRVKGAPKAADERTETDRKRQRRRKKKKQSILASIGAMNGEGIGDGEAAERVKKKKIRRSKMDFADQIQKLMQNGGQKRKRKELGENVGEKARKKKKRIIGKEKE